VGDLPTVQNRTGLPVNGDEQAMRELYERLRQMFQADNPSN
jgi:hypothetical protein